MKKIILTLLLIASTQLCASAPINHLGMPTTTAYKMITFSFDDEIKDVPSATAKKFKSLQGMIDELEINASDEAIPLPGIVPFETFKNLVDYAEECTTKKYDKEQAIAALLKKVARHKQPSLEKSAVVFNLCKAIDFLDLDPLVKEPSPNSEQPSAAEPQQTCVALSSHNLISALGSTISEQDVDTLLTDYKTTGDGSIVYEWVRHGTLSRLFQKQLLNRPDAIPCIKTLKGHTDWVRSIACHPTKDILASGSNDKTIRLWDITTGELIKILEGHTSWIRSLAFSPNGNTLASGSDNGTVKVWDTSALNMSALELLQKITTQEN